MRNSRRKAEAKKSQSRPYSMRTLISDLRHLSAGSFALIFALCISAHAQEIRKMRRIGILEPATSAAISARSEAFRRSLRELGYVEGRNITIESRYAEGKPERIPDLAADLVKSKPDV